LKSCDGFLRREWIPQFAFLQKHYGNKQNRWNGLEISSTEESRIRSSGSFKRSSGHARRWSEYAQSDGKLRLNNLLISLRLGLNFSLIW
jgi:hypothetical protein